MKNHSGQIIGVLQFINRKTSPDIKLINNEITEGNTLPFTDELAEVLLALSSQAAIAIDNATLITQIQNLFEGFVEASVTAIEQRDPTTSGHSFRVANLTTSLALALPRSSFSRFKDLSFDQTQIREIRYASLLHDFGKVGVREHVLVKAEKLPERGLELIRLRFAVFKEQLARTIERERLDYILAHGREAYRAHAHVFDERLRSEWERFSTFFGEIEAANQPTILPEGRFNHLEQIRDQPIFMIGQGEECLLSQDEFMALSVKKGSLTPAERLEIESHVRHTFNFLKRIPWTPDLRGAPEIAYAHHEKLDGTGYPLGLSADQIPLPSKIMTVADIFDALTASDRPYKPAMPTSRALEILEAEAGRGQLDGDLVKVFIEADIFKCTEQVPASFGDYPGFHKNFIQRNVCDIDLPV